MLNLLSNSLKCTSKGFIKVVLELLSLSYSFKITVTDTGIGMAEEVKN